MDSRTNRRGLDVTAHDRRLLERWARGRTTPQRLVHRSRIILLVADGYSDREVAKRLGATRSTVRLWRVRFEGGGPEALMVESPGRGRKGRVSPSALEAALRDTGPAKMSVRALARRLGVSASAVHRALVKERSC